MREVIRISIKVFLIFLISITVFCTFQQGNISIAATEFNTGYFKPSPPNNTEDQKLVDIGNTIIGPIQVIGSVVSVIAIVIIGIRYMVGSLEEKAQYKELLMPYLIGAILVFGITNLVAIIYNIATQL